MKTAPITRLFCSFAVALAIPSMATLISQPLGKDAPPGTLGGHAMAGFPIDARPLTDMLTPGDEVTEVAPPGSAPVSGTLSFSTGLDHLQVNSGWSTWSHGYVGDVYWFDEVLNGNTLTLTLPTDTKAFYLYLEPNFFDTFEFTVNSGVASETLNIVGQGGAQGVGFFGNAGESLLSLVITKTDLDFSDGFAVGEFGINSATLIPGMPDGSIPPLLTGSVLFALGVVRRWIRS